MRKREGLALRKLGREWMIVAESVELIDFDRIIALNDSAAYVWEALPERGFDSEAIAVLLKERYDVDAEIAEKDARELEEAWIKGGVIEEGN